MLVVFVRATLPATMIGREGGICLHKLTGPAMLDAILRDAVSPLVE
jgi:hypothetical protein